MKAKKPSIEYKGQQYTLIPISYKKNKKHTNLDFDRLSPPKKLEFTKLYLEFENFYFIHSLSKQCTSSLQKCCRN